MKIFESEFVSSFEKFIKDTAEDELADTVIRLLDFSGEYKIEINVSLYNHSAKDHTDIYLWHNNIQGYLYKLSNKIISNDEMVSTDKITIGYIVYDILEVIFVIADILSFDLIWHIKEKMEYNSLRKYKHGKLY